MASLGKPGVMRRVALVMLMGLLGRIAGRALNWMKPMASELYSGSWAPRRMAPKLKPVDFPIQASPFCPGGEGVSTRMTGSITAG